MNNTLIKGLMLLETLAHSERPLGITELGTMLGMSKSNVHRLLQALVENGYAVQDDATAAYRASIRLWELGSAVLAKFDLRNVASSHMEALLERTRETVHLSVLDGHEVVYVHKLDSPEPVRAYSQIGGRAPAYCVATGKVLLAYQRNDVLHLFGPELQAHSKRTITNLDALRAELDRVRTLGYAVNRGEWRDSVHGVAAPIRDARGQVIAAIGLSGPAERLRASMFKELGTKVMATASAIEQAMIVGARTDLRTTPLTIESALSVPAPRRRGR